MTAVKTNETSLTVKDVLNTALRNLKKIQLIEFKIWGVARDFCPVLYSIFLLKCLTKCIYN